MGGLGQEVGETGQGDLGHILTHLLASIALSQAAWLCTSYFTGAD